MKKSEQNKLGCLKPIADKNAIQEVVFTLHLDSETPLCSPDAYSVIHQGDFKNTFPKFDTVTRKGFLVNAANAFELHQMEAKIIGFSFEKYASNGNLVQRLRGEKPDPIDKQPDWIAVNILEYDRWDGEKAKAYSWFREVLKVQKDLKIKAVSLNYLDTLYWKSENDFPFEDIFKTDTMYLPKRIDKDAEKWASEITYEENKQGYKLLSKLKVSLSPNKKEKKIFIESPLTIIYDTSVILEDVLSERKSNAFEILHSENKKVMKDILTKNVCKLIGLI